MKHAGKIGLDTKSLMAQAQNMADGGYEPDYIGEWLTGVVTKAQEHLDRVRNQMMGNGGVQPTPGQLNGTERPYSDNNMPEGTYLRLKPNLHCSVLVEVIVLSLAGLMDECIKDPKGVNPYNYRSVSLNRFLDHLAERQFWHGDVPEKIESPEETEEMDVKDEKTGQMVTKKIHKMKDNPHYTLKLKQLKAVAEGVYEPWDPVREATPKWMSQQEDHEYTPTNEEIDLFWEGIKNLRKNLQVTFRMHNRYNYAPITTVNQIHTVEQLEIPEDASEELLKVKAKNYEQNIVTITNKGISFLQLYFYSWPQSDQKGIYTNYIMMGLNREMT